jgi:hypothetical protein
LNSIGLSQFKVFSTVLLNEKTNLRDLVDEFVNAYILLNPTKNFSYRILIPRYKDSSNFQAKKLGLSIQGEIILTMNRFNLKPSIKEIRYLHDSDHYGWLFISPELMERISN